MLLGSNVSRCVLILFSFMLSDLISSSKRKVFIVLFNIYSGGLGLGLLPPSVFCEFEALPVFLLVHVIYFFKSLSVVVSYYSGFVFCVTQHGNIQNQTLDPPAMFS